MTCHFCADDNQANCQHAQPLSERERIARLWSVAAEVAANFAVQQELRASEAPRTSHPEEAAGFRKSAMENREFERASLAKAKGWSV